MGNNRILVIAAGTGLMLATFVGCGGRSGEKEYNKAMNAWHDGDLVRARTHFEKAIRRISGNEKKSVAENNLGLVLWQLGEVDAATKAFSESCALSESLTGANLNLGIALFHAGRLDEAELTLNNVLGSDSDNETALSMLGVIAAQKRDWAGASRTLSKAVSANPNSPAAQNALALMEAKSGVSAGQAVTRLKQVLSAHPDYAPALFNLGVINDQWLHDPATATGYFKQYLQKAGDEGSHADAARQAIARLNGTGATTAQSDPGAAARYMAEGAKLHGARKYTEAIAQFQKAIETDPSQKNAHYNMGLAYYALKKYPETERACVNALRIDPRFADARYMLSLTYFQQRNWDAAEREARELSKVDAVRGEQMLKYISAARK